MLITALVIGFLTFIHEFGHFFFARLFGVPVLEFAIGMGPKIHSWEGKHGTKYALRALPIGGFVQMEGEEGESENPKAYNNLSAWKKIVVSVAGPAINIIFAIIVMFCIVLSTKTLGSTTVGEFAEGAISSSKLQINDEIVKVGNVGVHSSDELYYEITMNGYRAIDVTVIRDGERVVLEDVVFHTVEQSGTLFGVMDFRVYRLSSLKKVTVLDYLEQAFFRSLNTAKMVFDSLWGLLSGRFGADAVSGPIGMVGVVGDMAEASKDQKTISPLLNLIVLISMNLGIFNLLPIPALDGGRIVFHLIDGIAGKKVIKKDIEDKLIVATMMLLFALMIFISIKDVIKLF